MDIRTFASPMTWAIERTMFRRTGGEWPAWEIFEMGLAFVARCHSEYRPAITLTIQ